MQERLSIIIVNWNGMTFLPGCLRSIADSPPAMPYDVIVIDNASRDASVEWLRSEDVGAMFPDGNLKVIESGANLGFGQANNLVLERTDSAYFFLLNPDTSVQPGAIDKLIETLKTDDRFGVVVPKLLNPDGSLQPSVWGIRAIPLALIVDGLKLKRFIPKAVLSRWMFGEHWTYDTRRIVPIVAGAALMCRRKMYEEVGGFDPDFHMYGEDMEWCVRMNRKGWKICFEPVAEIFHLGGQCSLQRWSPDERGVVQAEANILFEKKCFSPRHRFLNSLSQLFVLGGHAARRRAMGVDNTVLRSQIKLHSTNCRIILRSSFASYFKQRFSRHRAH